MSYQMKPKHKSIQRKLMTVILLTTGAVLLLTCTVFFIYEYITYRDIKKTQLTTLGKIVAANSTAALAFDSKEDAAEILQALKAEKNIVAACLYDNEGHPFSAYSNQPSESDFPDTIGADGYLFKDGYLQGFQPVVQNEKRLGTLYLKTNLTDLYNRFRLYGLIAFIFISIAFLFAWFLSRLLQKKITKPILKLAETARIISDQGDYSVRASGGSNDEVGLLKDSFNQMLSQIEAQNEEITSLNQNLEKKVKERTGQLEDANAILVQQNEFVETIIDSSVDFIAVFDNDLRYLSLNKKAIEGYNVRKEDIIGKKVLDIFPQLKDSAMIEGLKKALDGQMVHEPGYRSGILNRLFENFFIPLKNKDNIVDRVLLVAHDLTDIISTNEKLKSLNTELEKSNRDLEQFAYVASHDLQEPLRKIQTFAELSERNINKPEILKRYLEKIGSSGLRMTDLIKAVLNYSRLSKADNEFDVIDLNIIVQNIQTDLELLIHEKKAVINATPLPHINGIPLQIHQLFLNLVTNSLKFSENRPEINISGNIIPGKELKKYPALKNEGNYLKLSFNDNGIGFEEQYADKLFSIFQRLHYGNKYKGTGIGLALCKKIVENHGGSITVKSEPGKGTTFYIYLPIAYKLVDNGRPAGKNKITS